VKRILFLAPHTDDAELGCGATIAKYVEQGSEVRVVAFSRAEDSLPPGTEIDLLEREMRASLTLLGVATKSVEMLAYPVRHFDEHRQDLLEDLVRIRNNFRPDWVFTPSAHDVHQDHRVVHFESVRAFNACALWGYELPWNHLESSLNGFVAIEPRHLERKQQALAKYESQVQLGRPYFMPEFSESLARIRGLQARQPLAEAFEVIRATA
jgi:LmbE family N-acetylglucosaminyl deacetylase